MTKETTLTIVRGLPGSGKSHYAKNLANDTGHLFYEPDHLITDVLGRYRFDSQIWDLSNDFVYRLTDFALVRKESTIVTDVFPNESSIERYIELTIAHKTKLNVVTIESNIFNSDGSLRNTHHLPLTVLEAMMKDFIPNLEE